MVMMYLIRCDTIGLDGQNVKGKVQASYTHAQKMCASMTYAFRRTYGFGSQPWQQTCLPDGKIEIAGNPSISEQVSHYMVSLRRRKVSNRLFQVVCFTLTFA